jgi:hypothetical protein
MITHDAAPLCGLRYIFEPKAYQHAPGFPRLDIFLEDGSAQPETRSPSLEMDIADGIQPITRLTLHHGSAQGERYQVCAGRIVASDDRGDTMKLFTFGGDLCVRREDGFTVCTITSPAPILPLHLHQPCDISERLAEEVEVLLARRRAAWAIDPLAYQHRLVQADPRVLYQACLEKLCHQFRDFCLEAEHDFMLEFTHFLQSEIQTIQKMGGWPPNLCSLEKLL